MSGYILDNLPGGDWSQSNSYVLHSYSGNFIQAVYRMEELPIFLTVSFDKDKELVAQFDFVEGLIKVSLGPFSFPHRHFSRFEGSMIRAYSALRSVDKSLST